MRGPHQETAREANMSPHEMSSPPAHTAGSGLGYGPPARARYTRAQLEAMATAILAAAEPPRRCSRDAGPPAEWSLSPVCADVDFCADEDAAEIAATFAELSGGWMVPRMLAHVSDEYAAGVLRRREYMRRARRDPETRARWRAAERERRRARRAAERWERQLSLPLEAP